MEGAGGTGGPGRGAGGRRRDRRARPRCRRAPEGLEGQAAVPEGGGGARPGFEPTRPATHSNTAPPVWRAPEGPEGQAAVPEGGGGAWTGYSKRHSTTGVKGAGGTGGHGRVSRRGAWPRCRRAAAGPGRASRSTTPSRRLACGDLAGGPPPTGTHSGPALQGRPRGGWRFGRPRGARNTSGATRNAARRRTERIPYSPRNALIAGISRTACTRPAR